MMAQMPEMKMAVEYTLSDKTIRDMFAAAALSGIIAAAGDDARDTDDAALDARLYADAMMEARRW